jgi:hypothetical protein
MVPAACELASTDHIKLRLIKLTNRVDIVDIPPFPMAHRKQACTLRGLQTSFSVLDRSTQLRRVRE